MSISTPTKNESQAIESTTRAKKVSAAKQIELISIDDYLAGELISHIKHEYLAGVVYAMSGASNVHNLIASNFLAALGARLRGQRCKAYNSDTKISCSAAHARAFLLPGCIGGLPVQSAE